jgi:subtilase family serine protease
LIRFSDGTRSLDATVSGLPAGARVVWSTQIKNGTYTITATADATNVIPETNEANNSLTRTFVVNGTNATAQ